MFYSFSHGVPTLTGIFWGMVFKGCWSPLCRVFFFRQTTLTGKCGKRARPDVLYEGSAEEEEDDDDGETVTISCHYDIMG